MPEVNCSVPPIECFVRSEYMRQHKDSHGRRLPCLIFGVASLPGQVPLFHFLMEDGGIWWRMPISAFCHKQNAADIALDELMLWDSFSYYVSVTRFDYLTNKRMEYLGRSKVQRGGRYLFTLDWCDPNGLGIAEQPGQHKCGHVIELDCGNFAIQPNNRVRVFEPSFVTAYGKPQLERLISDRIYSVETSAKWSLPSDERYEY